MQIAANKTLPRADFQILSCFLCRPFRAGLGLRPSGPLNLRISLLRHLACHASFVEVVNSGNVSVHASTRNGVAGQIRVLSDTPKRKAIGTRRRLHCQESLRHIRLVAAGAMQHTCAQFSCGSGAREPCLGVGAPPSCQAVKVLRLGGDCRAVIAAMMTTKAGRSSLRAPAHTHTHAEGSLALQLRGL